MNKNAKRTIYILICGIMFICGLLIVKYKDFNLPNQTIIQERNEEASPNSNLINLTQKQQGNDMQEQESSYSLTESELAFLEKHLFGQWRFSERLLALDQNKNIHYNKVSNISDEGVEELKKTVVLEYKESSVWFPVKIGQFSFTSTGDMYLFGMFGGFRYAENPDYYIEKMDTDIIHLNDAFYMKGHNIQLEGAENFIKVMYSTKPDEGVCTQRSVGWNFADAIYIDPNDADTIYVEFCGLWKMERDPINYRTGGKWYGKG